MSEPVWFRRVGNAVAVAIGAGWLVVLAMILRHRIFVSSDTVSNYAHVWYVSSVIVGSHRIPYHMSIIGHGHGLAFPYAFVPWLSAALLRPWLGDWVVTLWLVVGSVGLVAATFWAFPELRRGWWVALVLANPVVIVATVLGQLPFLWGAAMLLGAVACWRGGHVGWSIVLAGLGQATHAAIVLPMAAILVVVWMYWEPERRRLLLAYSASLLIAAPAVWLVFLTPAYTDTSTGVKVANLVGTLAPRLLVIGIPVVLVLLARVARPWMAPLLLVIFVVASVGLATQPDTRHAWGDLSKSPQRSMLVFLRSPEFRPGLEYRVLSTTDRRISMYQLIQHGGRLDSEFFPESLVRRTWSSEAQYCVFLRIRAVDVVVIDHDYDRRLKKNEHNVLRLLSSSDRDACIAEDVTVSAVGRLGGYDVYAVNR